MFFYFECRLRNLKNQFCAILQIFFLFPACPILYLLLMGFNIGLIQFHTTRFEEMYYPRYLFVCVFLSLFVNFFAPMYSLFLFNNVRAQHKLQFQILHTQIVDSYLRVGINIYFHLNIEYHITIIEYRYNVSQCSGANMFLLLFL